MAERLAASRLAVNRDANALDAPITGNAGIGIRTLAYAIDSALLFGVAMLFSTAAALVIFLSSNSGRDNVTDGQEWSLLAILMASIPAWFAFNVFFASKRASTVGQYVLGLSIEDDNGVPPAPKRLALYWAAFHPLFFHPFLALPWVLCAWLSVSLAENEAVFIVCLAMAMLCLLAPLAGFAFMSIDPDRRAIHDRLANLHVVRL
jgi:uncharacterized RDD family membrane protein YckC